MGGEKGRNLIIDDDDDVDATGGNATRFNWQKEGAANRYTPGHMQSSSL